jgi:hypothetical protein
MQRLEDLVAFVTGNPDLLAGFARQRNKVPFNGALRTAGRAAVDVTLLGFQYQGHSQSARMACQKSTIVEAHTLRDGHSLSICACHAARPIRAAVREAVCEAAL